VFPLMPVSIKTPACPVVVATTHPDKAGQWVPEASADATVPGGVWRFIDSTGIQRGFVLTAKQTARRMELAKATLA
jgi:rubredoxin-NAD+ reductase